LAWFLDAIEDAEDFVEDTGEVNGDGPEPPFVDADEAEEVHRMVRRQLEEMMAHNLKNVLRTSESTTRSTRNSDLHELKRAHNATAG
jgi:hypothetical protein